MNVPTPRLEISLAKIRSNAEIAVDLCRLHGIEVVGITKGTGGEPQVARAMLGAGIRILGDAHVQNLQKLVGSGVDAPLQLIRSPMMSQAEITVDLASVSLNTDLSTIKMLGEVASRKQRKHRVILMMEIGDHREGLTEKQMVEMVRTLTEVPGVEVSGVGGTLGCLTLSYPVPGQIEHLVRVAHQVEQLLGVKRLDVSLGGSSVLPLMMQKAMPPGVTHLRVGEAILLGYDAISDVIPHTVHDAFQLVAEVIEVQPASHQGQRAIVAIGFQDVEASGLTPQLPQVKIEGATSDHLFLRSIDPGLAFKAGQEVRFLPTYHALVQLCTSPYVSKDYIGSH